MQTCLKCGGKGEYEEPITGIVVKCDCNIGRERPENKKGIEYLQRKKAEEALKNSGDDTPQHREYTNGQNKSVYVYGAVPEHRKDDNYSPEYLRALAKERMEFDGAPLVGFKQYKQTLDSIYLSIQSGERLRNSYLICSHNGFSKETFANTCIKELYNQGKKVVPYLALNEIYNLIQAEHLLLRINKAYITEDNQRIDALQDTNEIVDWKFNRDTKLIFQNYDIEKFVSRYANFGFSYHDFIDAEVLFVRLTESFLQGYEMPTLRYLMKERASKGKVTIVFCDKALSSLKKEGDSWQSWWDIVAETSYEKRSLDKLVYITCHRDLKKAGAKQK